MANSQDVEKLRSLIKGVKIAMLTTAGADGVMHSRPMTTQEVEFDGDLWFFTGLDSGMVDESKQNQQVNVVYSAPDKYVSVSGEVILVRDRKKIEELWSPLFKGWFPGGVDDPNLALLKVSVTEAEYWESSGSPVVKLAGFVKSLRGERPDIGQNEKLTLKTPSTAASRVKQLPAITAKSASRKTSAKAAQPDKAKSSKTASGKGRKTSGNGKAAASKTPVEQTVAASESTDTPTATSKSTGRKKKADSKPSDKKSQPKARKSTSKAK